MMKNFLLTPAEINKTYWGRGWRNEREGYGIEIEVEGEGLPPHGTGVWNTHADQSLRGGGIEYVTNGPIRLQDIPDNVRALRDLINTVGAKVKFSYRCSTHFHMNVQHVTMQDILGICVVFSIVEPYLINMNGPDRDGNHFCLPSYCTGDMYIHVKHLCDTLLSNPLMHDFGRGKYAALNLEPISMLGSIEFRTFPGSLDPTHIHRWATWLDNIKNVAVACPDKSFVSLLAEAQAEPHRFVDKIFGLHGYPTNLVSLLDKGCEHANDICSALIRRVEKPTKTKSKKIHRDVDPWEVDMPVPHPMDIALERFAQAAPANPILRERPGARWRNPVEE